MTDTVDTSKEAVQHALYLLECGEHNEQIEEQRNFILAFAAERDQLRREVEEARDKALEEAAMMAQERWEHWNNQDVTHGVQCDFTACADISSAIRALKAHP